MANVQDQAGQLPPDPAVVTEIAERVNLMEAARHKGEHVIRLISESLKSSRCRADPDIKSWLDSYANLLDTIEKREILIGVLGETGLGKSSLINQIIGIDICPTNQAEACTAAVCVFAWNESNMPGSIFRARVTYKSTSTVAQDLESFRDELEEVEVALQDENEAPDPDLKRRIADLRKTQATIQAWSGLPADVIRSALSAKEIIKQSNHKALKGASHDGQLCDEAFVEEIKAPGLRAFSQLLKPLIDSTNRRKKDWPLVELVEVFVKSDILRHGVKIVDLPGVMDSLESRSVIAKSFMWRLDTRIIAVAATRGADNKTAFDLMLPGTEAVDMELDNKFGQDSLAIALNKTDDIGIDNAVDDWADDQKIPESVEAIETLKEMIDDISSSIEEVKGELGMLEEDDNDTVTDNAKRRRNTDEEPQDKTDAERELEHRLNSLMNKRQTLEREQNELKNRLKHLCIVARSNRLTQLISEVIHTGRETTGSKGLSIDDPGVPLANIFPNSARAHAALVRGETMEGFPDLESTGITALRDWIERSTLPQREEAAQTHLQRLHILIDAVDGWTQNHDLVSESDRLPAEHLDGILHVLSTKNDALANHMKKKVHTSLSRGLTNLTPVRQTHIGSRQKHDNGDDGLVDLSAEKLARAVDTWPLRPNVGGSGTSSRMHCFTYRACVRRYGGVWDSKSRPPARYHWMGTVYLCFWRPCMQLWREAFHKRVPRLMEMAVSTARHVFSNFLRDLLANPQLPEVFKEVLKRSMYLLNNVLETYVDGIKTKIRNFINDSRESRPKLERQLDQSLRAVFHEAKVISGKGSFKKMEAHIKASVNIIKRDMFKLARDDLEKTLYDHKTKHMRSIQDLWNVSGHKRIKQHLARLAQASCVAPSGTRTSASSSAAPTMTEEATKGEVQQQVGTWRQYWAGVGPRLPQPKIGMTFDEAEAEELREAKQAKKRNTKATKGAPNPGSKKKSATKARAKPGKKPGPVKIKAETPEPDIKVEKKELDHRVEDDVDSDTEEEEPEHAQKRGSTFFD